MQKESCSLCRCHNPSLSLFLVRMGVGFLFLIPGILKFQEPVTFMTMLHVHFGWTDSTLVLATWFVVMFEIVGGLVLLLGKLVPRFVYKLAILGISVIALVALFKVHIPSGEIVGILFMSLATLCVLALWFSAPMCPMGITGYKEENCSVGKK